MKKKIHLLLFILIQIRITSFAQNIGIGTIAPKQKLHIAGGLRVDTLSNNVDSGLLRHNPLGTVYSLKFTGDSTQMLRGNGTFGPSGIGLNWSISGNSGINAANNFIGTRDNNPLQFRVNNQVAGMVDSVTGNSFFGYASGRNATGTFNTAMGIFSLMNNTTGIFNTASGFNALSFNT